MTELPQQFKNNRDNTSHSTQARVWCVLIFIILFTFMAMIAPVVIVCITKSPYALIGGIIPLGAGIRLGNIWERIVNAHFELNDREYDIKEIEANRSNGERREHKDKDKNSTISNKNRSRFHEAFCFLYRLLEICKKRAKWP